MELLKTIFFDPIFNALIIFYNALGDIGLAIIAITVVIKLLLLPLSNKALRSQRRLQALQPELKKLQAKHKDDREKLAQELMAFYRKEGVNPASSCLPVLVQLPVLATLFFVFKDAVAGKDLDRLYSFVSRPEAIDPYILGTLDLSQRASAAHPELFILALLAAALQYWQSRMLMPKDADLPTMNRQLLVILPVLTFVFSVTLPAALPLYWAAQALFTIVQQRWVMRELPAAKARQEAVADWNQANPDDPVGGAKPAKSVKSKGSATVTVRKRGKRKGKK